MLNQWERADFMKAARIIAGEAAKEYLESRFMIYELPRLVSAIERRLPHKLKEASDSMLRQLKLGNSLSELGQQNFALTIMEAGAEAAQEVGYYPKTADAISLTAGPMPNEQERLAAIPDDPMIALRFSK